MIYAEDITGTIAQWLDDDMDPMLSDECIMHLEYVYALASKTFEQEHNPDIHKHSIALLKDRIYRATWFEHVYQDVSNYFVDWSDSHEDAQLLTEEQREALFTEVAKRYVYNGDYDCNSSYWTNIETLLEDVMIPYVEEAKKNMHATNRYEVSSDIYQHIRDYFQSSSLTAYELVHVVKSSNHPTEPLYMAVAKHTNGEYAVWTCWNDDRQSLNYGHYNLPSWEAAEKVICDYTTIFADYATPCTVDQFHEVANDELDLTLSAAQIHTIFHTLDQQNLAVVYDSGFLYLKDLADPSVSVCEPCTAQTIIQKCFHWNQDSIAQLERMMPFVSDSVELQTLNQLKAYELRLRPLYEAMYDDKEYELI